MQKVKWILLVALLICWANALPLDKIRGKCVLPSEFNHKQKATIIKALNYGLKSGYGYTMAAIAWKESCAGEYRINLSDPSAGIYHAYIPGVIKKNNEEDNSFMRNMVAELLIRDDDYASKLAIEELLYWHKVRGGDWQKVVKSYNKGFSWEKDAQRNKMANDYYEDITKRVKILKNYIPKISSSLAKKAKNDIALASLNEDPHIITHKSATPKIQTPTKNKQTFATNTLNTLSTPQGQSNSQHNANKISTQSQNPTNKTPNTNTYTSRFYLLEE